MMICADVGVLFSDVMLDIKSLVVLKYYLSGSLRQRADSSHLDFWRAGALQESRQQIYTR